MFFRPIPLLSLFPAAFLLFSAPGAFAAGRRLVDRAVPAERRGGHSAILRSPAAPAAKPAPAGASVPCSGCRPPEVPMASSSRQTRSGPARFAPPIAGRRDGRADGVGRFPGELLGDVVGDPGATRIANVPAAALPAIGFGPDPGARVKHVFAGADPADARRDGSLAHPYGDLASAALAAQNGDRFILHGELSGGAVFNAYVALEGAGADQTVIYGSLEFAGYGPSRVRRLRINCSDRGACVNNRSMNGGALTLEGVQVLQSLDGAAVASVSGPVIAQRCEFRNLGAGMALSLAPFGAFESRLSDCVATIGPGAAALTATGGSLTILNSKLLASGSGPAVVLSGVDRFTARAMDATSAGTPLALNRTGSARVFDSVLTSGSRLPVVTVGGAPVETFTAPLDPRLLFANNLFVGNFSAPFSCTVPALVLSSGNLIPNNPDPAAGAPGGSCALTTYPGF